MHQRITMTSRLATHMARMLCPRSHSPKPHIFPVANKMPLVDYCARIQNVALQCKVCDRQKQAAEVLATYTKGSPKVMEMCSAAVTAADPKYSVACKNAALGLKLIST